MSTALPLEAIATIRQLFTALMMPALWTCCAPACKISAELGYLQPSFSNLTIFDFVVPYAIMNFTQIQF